MLFERHLTQALCLCALIAACDGPSASEQRAPTPPALATDAPPCGDADVPAARAREALERGEGQAERYPFVPQQGVAALALLSEARACFERAGDIAAARRAADRRAQLLKRMERDYRDLRIRLSRALSATRHAQALRAARHLLALLRDRKGDYVDYLRTLEHELARRSHREDAS